MKRYPLALCAALLLSAVHTAHGDELTDTARGLLVKFTEAVMAGPDEVAPILAPEYQIMRSNGVGYNREEYINKGVATLSFKPGFDHDELHVTQSGDILVVRYFLEINEEIDGTPITKRAPRLTVFRKIDGEWKVTAHSNFARFE